MESPYQAGWISAAKVELRGHSERYRRHLASDYWREVRRTLHERSRGRCERCVAEVGWRGHGHHLTYTWLGRELEAMHTVAWYCEGCHEFVHHRSPYDPCTIMSDDDLLKRISEM